MKNATKVIAIFSLVGTMGIAGLARNVYASQSQTRPQIALLNDGNSANNITNAKQVKSVAINDTRKSTKMAQTSDGDGETNDDAEEKQETAKLQPLAKITAQQAQQAAEASVNGKASRVKLENEDSNLVYAVVIGQQEVKVDAGNGEVLYTENDNQENDTNEASRLKSSIQVSQNNNGDAASGMPEGHRETNDDGK